MFSRWQLLWKKNEFCFLKIKKIVDGVRSRSKVSNQRKLVSEKILGGRKQKIVN